MLTEEVWKEGAGRKRLESVTPPPFSPLRYVKRSRGKGGPRATPADPGGQVPPPSFTKVQPRAGVSSIAGGTYPTGAAAGGLTPPRARDPQAGQEGAGGRSPSAEDAPRSSPRPPPSSPPAGPANSGFCRASLARSSAAENPSGGGSPPRSPGKSGGGRQGSPSVLGEEVPSSLLDWGPRPGAPTVGPSVQSLPPHFSPQSAQTATR